MSTLAKLLDEAAPLEQFLETAQCGADRFPVVDTHPKRHSSSFLISCRGASNNAN
jgi:hypothetical protein